MIVEVQQGIIYGKVCITAEKSYHPTPVPEIWRLDLVKELLGIRDITAILMTGKQMKSPTAFSSYAPPSF